MMAAHKGYGKGPSLSVPMLDVPRQNGPLRKRIDAAMADVCDRGAFVHGPACAEFEAAMAEYCGTEFAVGCASGSDALLLALMGLGVGPGDEVILPSFTFFATAGSVWRLGAIPVFAEILPENFNIDPASLKQKITSATKAIIPVHLFGQCAEMDEINRLAEDAGGLPVVEDAAQAIGAQHQGRRAGSLGKVGCFSFYPTKNLGGFGDGGMITTNDGDLANRFRQLRNHGQHPQYKHDIVGVNSRLDTLQAAVLNVKLPMLDQWAESRGCHAARYNEEFARRGMAEKIVTPTTAKNCQSVWNQYTIRVLGGKRDELRAHLADHQVGSAIYYPIPLHRQTCFAALGYQPGSLPHTEQAAEEVLSLPVFPELARKEQDRVLDVIEAFYEALPTTGSQFTPQISVAS